MKTVIDPEYCKGCNICVHICPKGVYLKGKKLSDMGYFVPEVAAPEKCLNYNRSPKKLICELCVLSCPDMAIRWIEED